LVSLASVVQLAGHSRQYVAVAVKNSPKRSEELRQEMSNISTLLDSLDHVAPDSIFTDKGPIDEFHAILKEMNAHVAKPMINRIGRWKWPFTEEENNRLLLKIERYKATFNLAVSIETK